MLSEKEVSRLNAFLTKAITGQLSLDCRKRLAHGEVVSVSLSDEETKFTIKVENGKAFLRNVDHVVLESEFISWSAVDDDYEAMIKSFNEHGEVSNDWFEQASLNYQCRFE